MLPKYYSAIISTKHLPQLDRTINTTTRSNQDSYPCTRKLREERLGLLVKSGALVHAWELFRRSWSSEELDQWCPSLLNIHDQEPVCGDFPNHRLLESFEQFYTTVSMYIC